MQKKFIEKIEKTMLTLEHSLASFFSKGPHLPLKGKMMLAQAIPWIALIQGCLRFMGTVSALILASWYLQETWFGGLFGNTIFILILLVGFSSSVLEILAFNSLRRREVKGWNCIFAAALLVILSSLFDNMLGYGYVRNLIGPLLSLWLIFEVRSEYRKA